MEAIKYEDIQIKIAKKELIYAGLSIKNPDENGLYNFELGCKRLKPKFYIVVRTKKAGHNGHRTDKIYEMYVENKEA